MAADTPAEYFKQPAEIETIGIEFADRLASGETISSVALLAVDTADDSDVLSTIVEGNAEIGDIGADGITFTENASGTGVGITIKAGTDRKIYKLTVEVTTSASHVREKDVKIYVND